MNLLHSSEKKQAGFLFAIIIALIAAAILIATGKISLPNIKKFWAKEKKESAANFESVFQNKIKPDPLNVEFYGIALERAKEWQQDAALSSLETEYSEHKEAPRKWKLMFVSKNSSQGLLVHMSDNAILSTQEIPYHGSGAELSSEIITPEEAVKRVKAMPGYEEASIDQVSAVYGTGTEAWYWGVHTSMGVVSVEAKN